MAAQVSEVVNLPERIQNSFEGIQPNCTQPKTVEFPCCSLLIYEHLASNHHKGSTVSGSHHRKYLEFHNNWDSR